MMENDQTLIIELNEFNLELLKFAAESLDLKNIKRILSFQSGTTLADQLKEHQGLDPWVQWVSVHSESPSQVHGVIRLGDVSKLELTQVWERLGKAGISTGVWGVMNASRNNCPNNQYFIADPWTYTESAYPTELNQFLALPVYFAKNYLDLSIGKLLKSGLKTFWFMLRNINFISLLSDFAFLFKGLLKSKKIGTSFLFSAYELIATRVFAKYKKKYNPKVNFIFINSIAHFQHHDWHQLESLNETTAFVFKSIDRMLEIILPENNEKERVLVLSALSQKNVSNEGFYCYRQINPSKFLNSIGVNFSHVEQCMTNDGHVFFQEQADRDKAAEILSNAKVNDQCAFFVEVDNENPRKLFYQVAIWDKLEENAILKFEHFEIPFYSQFAIYAKRTGAHIPIGHYFANGISFPEEVKNSEVFSYVWAK